MRAIVAPQFVPVGHRLYSVEEEYNAVVLEGAFLEGQMLLGKGAGSHPTGSAVLSDLSALSYGYGYEYRKLREPIEHQLPVNFEARVYFRYQDPSVLSEIQFTEIEESFRSRDYAYLTGKVRLHELLRLQRSGKWRDLFVALLPEERNSVSGRVSAKRQAVLV